MFRSKCKLQIIIGINKSQFIEIGIQQQDQYKVSKEIFTLTFNNSFNWNFNEWKCFKTFYNWVSSSFLKQTLIISRRFNFNILNNYKKEDGRSSTLNQEIYWTSNNESKLD